MSPVAIVPEQVRADSPLSSTDKPVLYMLDKFHPGAIEHAHSIFQVILPNNPEIHNWQENAEYLLIRNSSLSAEQIHAARRLRAIGKQGVGIDKIDADACSARGIRILNTPGVNATAVAELVLALTMTVAREIGSIQVQQHSGRSVPKETCSGLILTGKTLGLLGMGNIGKAVARMFHGAFGAEIIAYDPFSSSGAWDDIPHVRAETIHEVLRSADVLSVHVPLTKDTRGLIGYDELAIMKPTAILINAARGGIVDETDLARALSEGLIWGAGIDAHVQEPPTYEQYGDLWKHSRVVSTPHIGAATSQTQCETAMAAIDYVYHFSVGEKKVL